MSLSLLFLLSVFLFLFAFYNLENAKRQLHVDSLFFLIQQHKCWPASAVVLPYGTHLHFKLTLASLHRKEQTFYFFSWKVVVWSQQERFLRFCDCVGACLGHFIPCDVFGCMCNGISTCTFMRKRMYVHVEILVNWGISEDWLCTDQHIFISL